MKNNNEQFENFIRDFDKIRMTNSEKESIAKNIELFTHTYNPKPSPYQYYLPLFKKTLALALIILLTISISKPVSAKALPGELLYSVKIIHEEIEAASIHEPKKKINFEIKRTETRIREAVKLAETKELNDQIQTKIAKKIKTQVVEISEKIKEMTDENPEQALALNSNLKTTLKVNSEALKKVTQKTKVRKTKRKNGEKNKNNTPESSIKETHNLAIKNIPEISHEKDNEIQQESAENNDFSEKNILPETLENSEKLNLNGEENNEIEEKNAEIENDDYTVEIIEESFADIILESIEKDIIGTENASETIKEEIISAEEELNIKETITDDILSDEETPLIDESEIKTDDEESLVEDTHELEIPEQEIETITDDILSDEETPLIDESEVKIDDKESLVEDTHELEITTPTNVTESIKIKMTSLEQILDAEKRLNSLLNELNIQRNELSINEVNKFVEDKQFGKAYIYIQNEIENLSEQKLKRELGIEAEEIDVKNIL